MKSKARLSFVCGLFCIASMAGAQGFIYDQQSANENTSGGVAIGVQPAQPFGQSFTPSLTSVGFIRLSLSVNGGTTAYLNLRSDSITGNILASTTPITFPTSVVSVYQNFFFSTSVSVIPGTTYFFQPVIQSGPGMAATVYNTYYYAGGTAFENGAAITSLDLWFREGIVVPVPEPASTWLGLFGGAVLIFARRWSHLHPTQ